MKTLVLIPTYNEKDNLIPLVDKVLSLSPDIYILIIDDNSPDGTGELADKLAKQFRNLSVLHRQKKEGLGKAYIDGFKYALNRDVDYIIQMDSDFSHDPLCIPDFLRKIQNYDLVIGSRFINNQATIINYPLYRLILSRGAGLYLKVFSGLNLTDYTSGFKCFRRVVIEKLALDKIKSFGFAFQFEINYLCYKLGFKIGEIPIIFLNRNKGMSKLSLCRTIWDTFRIVWRLKYSAQN